MNGELQFFPDQAATNAAQVDQLYSFLVGVTVFFTLLIFLLIVYFALRYRRRALLPGGLPQHGFMAVEVSWSLVPLVVVAISFVWGARLYLDAQRSPADTLDLFVVGKQWMWKVYHPEGRREINEMHVPLGQPVRLIMISEDVIHSFFVPAFRRKQDVLPGRYTSMWFEASRLGTYHLFCAEYCGTSHSRMRGRVVVMRPDEYASWSADSVNAPVRQEGKDLVAKLQCDSCHNSQESSRGPLLPLARHTTVLSSGKLHPVDYAYIRESLLNPGAKLVAGYENRMPTFEGKLSEESIWQIAAYLRSSSAE